MVTYFLTIDHVLSSDPKVLTRVILTMERDQGLLGTLEVVSDCQPLPALRVLAIIEPINVGLWVDFCKTQGPICKTAATCI
jgi:hypothetical protein